MALFRGRPLALFCFAFLSSSYFGVLLPVFVKPVAAAAFFLCALLCAALAFFLSRQFRLGMRRAAASFLAFFVVALAAAFSFQYFYLTVDLPGREAENRSGTRAICICEVLSCGASGSYYANYDLALREADGVPAAGRIRLTLNAGGGLEAGDLISCPLDFSLPTENLYGTNLRNAYLAQGIRFVATLPEDGEIRIIGRAAEDVFDLAQRINERLNGIFERVLDGRDGGLSAALILGRREALSDAFQRDVRRLGLAHLLALSGMHLTLLTGGLSFLLSLLRCGKRLRCALLIPFVLGYAVLTGLSGSVVRAALMLVLYYAAFLLGRQADSLTSLLLAVSLILFVSPLAIYDVGLVLSFLTMLSMVTVSAGVSRRVGMRPSFRHLPRPVSALLSSLLYSMVSSFFAVLFTLPAMWIYFDEVSLLGVPMTLLFTPLVQGQLALAALLLLFCWVPFLSSLLGAAAVFLSGLIFQLSDSFSRMRGITLSLGYPFAGAILLSLAAVLLLLLLFCKRRRALGFCAAGTAAVLTFAVCLLCYHGACRGTRVLCVSDGGNDALLFSAEGKTVICDFSTGSYGFVQECLAGGKELYATELEAYVLTHYHERHISSVARLLAEKRVRALWLPEPEDARERGIFEALCECAGAAGTQTVVYSEYDEISLGFGGLFLRSERRRLARSTHPILALTLSDGACRLIYLGASFWEGDADIFAMTAGASGIICGRHGPKIKHKYAVADSICLPENGEKRLILP